MLWGICIGDTSGKVIATEYKDTYQMTQRILRFCLFIVVSSFCEMNRDRLKPVLPAVSGKFQGGFVDVAPSPGFARLKRAHNWVFRRVEMLGGVLVL
jgi:hypothetical protein